MSEQKLDALNLTEDEVLALDELLTLYRRSRDIQVALNAKRLARRARAIARWAKRQLEAGAQVEVSALRVGEDGLVQLEACHVDAAAYVAKVRQMRAGFEDDPIPRLDGIARRVWAMKSAITRRKRARSEPST